MRRLTIRYQGSRRAANEIAFACWYIASSVYGEIIFPMGGLLVSVSVAERMEMETVSTNVYLRRLHNYAINM